MNKDKLQEQAREYANNPQMVTRSLEAAFIAGAESRQAEIDELKEALREATEWVSVEDRLPESRTPVLTKLGEDTFDEYNVEYGVCAFVNVDVWINQFGVVDELPTHWRPITSPKAEQILKKYEKC